MLDLLKAAARVATPTGQEALPTDILSFTLEYPEPVTAEAARGAIATLLEADRFDLFRATQADEDMLVLQFPGVPIEQSPGYLFAEAAALKEALGLVSVTPDILPPFTDAESVPPPVENVGDVIWDLCRAHTPPLADRNWALRLIRADRAMTRFGVTGAGQRIGQPDTGVAAHNELDHGIDMARGYNFVDNTPDPTDPLLPSMGSPGHGTGTASLVISRRSGRVNGSAPRASLVPLRTNNAVVVGSWVPVARALDHARAQGCRIVTMSLGSGFGPRVMRRAVARAVSADMIVMAAAGNCVRFVTYPAFDRNVIAVAGVDHAGRRWRGSCRGPEVDVSAPAENLHVARRRPGQVDLSDVTDTGQGTSFAVALTAGVAALWLEHHGWSALRQEAHRRGWPLQELFRAALSQTAHAPAGWDHGLMGAGIVDAEALLALDPADIVGGAASESAGPAELLFGADFDAGGLQTEAEYLAFDWRLREQPEASVTVENAMREMPSPALADLLGDRQPLGEPGLVLAPAAPPAPLDRAFRRLAAGRGGTTESAADLSYEASVDRLRGEGLDTVMETVNDLFKARAESAPDLVDTAMQAEAADKIRQAVQSHLDPDRDVRLSPGEVGYALEALVKLSGRPAIRVHENGDELFDPLLGSWRADLLTAVNRWQPLVRAVGRIDARNPQGVWVHVGTGFLLSDGLVMTNRHVIDAFAEPMPEENGQRPFKLRFPVSIIFDPEAADETTRYTLTEVVTAGASRIGRTVNMARLDMALMRIDPDNSHAPPPDPIDRGLISTTDPVLTKILVAGYPAEPRNVRGPDPREDRDTYLAFWARLGELYGDRYGVKYISPGMIEARPGAVAGDPRGWAFSHDATTLPGNSGSAILSLHNPGQLCGLHFGGQSMETNLAHDIEAVLGMGDGAFATGLLNGQGE
ncbi:S8/S53 family peptidase [Ruegeria pomeroyi]|uniref:S8/S53 family peptidase n=1 Tax=Ruegeria pomeroyi TaxID=89184 RepID=A0A9Q3ZME4_9RHOB|nr:S8 family serine peptidase [Ruegeria pomeroyi]MCE8536881.1 S8/S53 family peptidase [Ruegeria pomeroyi]